MEVQDSQLPWSHNLKYYLKRYIQEFIEALIAYSLLTIAINKGEYNIWKLLKVSGFIGFITLALEEYEPSYKDNMKTGMVTLIGTTLMKI